MRMTNIAAGAVVTVLIGSGAAAQQPPLPAVELGIGMHRIRAELANTHPARMQGLMFRKSLAPNTGMLFDFSTAEVHCMWMKNTLIPLSVAFIDTSGEIVNIANMKPHSEQPHCAARPVRFALEMSRGWFAERGIGPGQKLRGLQRFSTQ